jgi:hypothetical protein
MSPRFRMTVPGPSLGGRVTHALAESPSGVNAKRTDPSPLVEPAGWAADALLAELRA